MNNPDDMVYGYELIGEASIDVGGPFRESLSNVSKDIQSDILPLMIRSANNKNNHGEHRDCYVINSNSRNPSH